MTTLSWLPVGVGLRGTNYGGNEAEIIAWLDDFFLKMESLDFTQTADTGQYVYGGGGKTFLGTTVGQSLAYRIYKFEDAFASTHPLFIKLEFKRGLVSSLVAGAYIQSVITVGTATDGAGVVTTNVTTLGAAYGTSNANAYAYSLNAKQSYACTAPSKGFAGVVFNPGQHLIRYVSEYGAFFHHTDLCFFLERIPNPDGTPSTLGYTLYAPSASVNWGGNYNYAHNYTNATIMTAQTKLFEGALYSTANGIPIFPQTFIVNDFLVNHFYHTTPSPVRSLGLAAIRPETLGGGTQFTVNVYGNTETNFLNLPSTSALRASHQGTDLAMLWE